MTEDFKEKILNYFIGNYDIEKGNNEPQFLNLENEINNLRDYLYETVGNKKIFSNGIIQTNTANNTPSLLNIMYGYYGNNSDTKRGFICILDSDFNPQKIITEYSSGSPLGEIILLNSDEDGLFYGIEETYNTDQKRFIMLNNISIKSSITNDYQMTLRQSYNLNQTLNQINYKSIKKRIGSAEYVGVGQANKTNITAFKLKINVGIENEWETYVLDSDLYSISFSYNSVYCDWDNNNELILKIGCMTYEQSFSETGKYSEFTAINNSFSRITFNGIQIEYFTDLKVQFLNINTAYVGIYGGDLALTYDQIDIYIINYSNNNLERIYSKITIGQRTIGSHGIDFFLSNGNIFYKILAESELSEENYALYFGLIFDNKCYEGEPIELPYSVSGYTIENFYVNCQYNLYRIYFQIKNNCCKTSLIFNNLNYNGTNYQDINSMIPNSVIFYDDTNNPIFARNLYNKIVNNNITESVVEVPYNFLNNTKIKEKKLIGVTNGILITDDKIITTNIYENLLINFFNKINVKNELNEILNINGAAKLNNSISNLLDYNDTKMTKIRINYCDDTNEIKNIHFTNTNNPKLKKLTFIIGTKKLIKNVELISNDETTIYNNIDFSDIELDESELYTYFRISQEVEIV